MLSAIINLIEILLTIASIPLVIAIFVVINNYTKNIKSKSKSSNSKKDTNLFDSIIKCIKNIIDTKKHKRSNRYKSKIRYESSSDDSTSDHRDHRYNYRRNYDFESSSMSTDDHKKYADIISSLKFKLRDKNKQINEERNTIKNMRKTIKNDGKKKEKLKDIIMKLNSKIRHKDNIIKELKDCVFNDSIESSERCNGGNNKYDCTTSSSSDSDSNLSSIFDCDTTTLDSESINGIRSRINRHRSRRNKRKNKYKNKYCEREYESDGDISDSDENQYYYECDRGAQSDSTICTTKVEHRIKYVDEDGDTIKTCDRCEVMRDKMDYLVELIDVLQDEVDRTSNNIMNNIHVNNDTSSRMSYYSDKTSYNDDIKFKLDESMKQIDCNNGEYNNVINTICMYCDTLEYKIDLDINEVLMDFTSKHCEFNEENMEKIINSLEIPIEEMKRYREYSSNYSYSNSYSNNNTNYSNTHPNNTTSYNDKYTYDSTQTIYDNDESHTSSGTTLHSICSLLSKPKKHYKQSIHEMSHGDKSIHSKNSKHSKFSNHESKHDYMDDAESIHGMSCVSSFDSNMSVNSNICNGVTDRVVYKRYKLLLKQLRKCRTKNIKLQLKVDSLIAKIEYLKKIKCAITFTGGMKLKTVEAKFKYKPEYEIYFQCYGYPKNILDIAKVDLHKIKEIRDQLMKNADQCEDLESKYLHSKDSLISYLTHNNNNDCDSSSSNCHVSNCNSHSKDHRSNHKSNHISDHKSYVKSVHFESSSSSLSSLS